MLDENKPVALGDGDASPNGFRKDSDESFHHDDSGSHGGIGISLHGDTVGCLPPAGLSVQRVGHATLQSSTCLLLEQAIKRPGCAQHLTADLSGVLICLGNFPAVDVSGLLSSSSRPLKPPT